jgi:NAD(P)-dependent dehydrogenase (short-subunit alcohol dehydrogenase family)
VARKGFKGSPRASAATQRLKACDASSGEEALALADRVRRTHGAPDVIVNCAGAGQWKLIEDTAPEEALAMLQAPYLAAFNMTHAFMREMLERRSGVLIHVNSPASIFPWPSAVGYTASRWALRGLHESLCQDLAGTGVRSCHLVLARVDSPYFEHNPGVAEAVPGIARMVRTLSTEECGRVIADWPRTRGASSCTPSCSGCSAGPIESCQGL